MTTGIAAFFPDRLLSGSCWRLMSRLGSSGVQLHWKLFNSELRLGIGTSRLALVLRLCVSTVWCRFKCCGGTVVRWLDMPSAFAQTLSLCQDHIYVTSVEALGAAASAWHQV